MQCKTGRNISTVEKYSELHKEILNSNNKYAKTL